MDVVIARPRDLDRMHQLVGRRWPEIVVDHAFMDVAYSMGDRARSLGFERLDKLRLTFKPLRIPVNEHIPA